MDEEEYLQDIQDTERHSPPQSKGQGKKQNEVFIGTCTHRRRVKGNQRVDINQNMLPHYPS